jgi:hypothetical protein
MLHDLCDDGILARGVRLCAIIDCENTTYANYTICKECSEKTNRCEKCGGKVDK